ncbi:putative poly(A) polymerase large subunit [Alphaentomopoxvirus acuprea]|uniref:Poly(A) polymerase catalytic subunit n=1 Tax=Alphaentomopoxvirus acuprea TaxID=62099 RepID=W6JLK0_9POXV|nr:putative poly(A) polymerase large subunit [Anomala cuprea entomopoxvirus]BAO49506.1 putative poly(A) polymerase large subunit [Anomala cuprea entomopoxvirus]
MNIYIRNKPLDIKNALVDYNDKINDIVKFDKNKFIKQLISIRDIYVNDFIDTSKNDDISRRVNEYFDKQNVQNLKLGSIKSIIKFQHIIVTYVSKLLDNIIIYNNSSKMVDMINFLSLTSKIVPKDNDKLNNILKEYIYNSKLKNISKQIKKNENTEHDISIATKIGNILENILKTILIIKNNDCLCYGSFTCYNINCNIKYNDIDLYSTDAFRIVMFFMIIIHFIIGYDTYMFSIPFILGHISLKYKNIFLIDCIFMDKPTLNCIPKVLINNIYFIDPGYQMLNNFRMLSENFRSYKINEDIESAYIKYKTLLNYFTLNNSFNNNRLNNWLSKKLTMKDIPYYIENYNIIIDIKKIIETSPYDQIIIILGEPYRIMNELKKLNGNFSRKYGSFLNEIFFETSLTDKNKIIISGGQHKYTQIVDENKLSRIKITSIDNKLNIDSKKKYLIFSNLTTSTYLYINNDVKELSLKNLISFLSTTSLYCLLHKKCDFGMELYYCIISLLTLHDTRKITEYKVLDRYKLEGKHIEISISKNLFSSITRPKETTCDMMNYEEFIGYTNINGGF